ncbi:MAG: SDR family NAD(P)-dependent oxidoreductase [Kutzneria sp.]|nr:SDR family NAD(P)-dependent oxidoreductase [Kutzneria sp.]MBV9844688.1 SDR family NAD(P)-dependent oxidoreductase [Kutzneria sp.]
MTITQNSGAVPQSIAVFGAGPGLGQAVARRYAREGYAVVLVARRQKPLDLLAEELVADGTTAHVITADLSDTDAVAPLAERIRARVGNPDAFYYGPAGSDTGFTRATTLTPRQAQDFMPLAFSTLLALVQEFLPHMIQRGHGAILTAQGASAVLGMPGRSGPGPALAAQRNYLQSLHAEVAEKGVHIGRLYIGAAIESSAFHADMEKARAAGTSVPQWPTVDPAHLADLLWTMHTTKGQPEVIYPAGFLGH